MELGRSGKHLGLHSLPQIYRSWHQSFRGLDHSIREILTVKPPLHGSDRPCRAWMSRSELTKQIHKLWMEWYIDSAMVYLMIGGPSTAKRRMISLLWWPPVINRRRLSTCWVKADLRLPSDHSLRLTDYALAFHNALGYKWEFEILSVVTFTKLPKMWAMEADEGSGTLKMANCLFSLLGMSFLPPPGVFMHAIYLHFRMP